MGCAVHQKYFVAYNDLSVFDFLSDEDVFEEVMEHFRWCNRDKASLSYMEELTLKQVLWEPMYYFDTNESLCKLRKICDDMNCDYEGLQCLMKELVKRMEEVRRTKSPAVYHLLNIDAYHGELAKCLLKALKVKWKYTSVYDCSTSCPIENIEFFSFTQKHGTAFGQTETDKLFSNDKFYRFFIRMATLMDSGKCLMFRRID